jgi:hypothetical protein
MELDLQSLFELLCTTAAVSLAEDHATIYEGAKSAKIDDISVCSPGEG